MAIRRKSAPRATSVVETSRPMRASKVSIEVDVGLASRQFPVPIMALYL